MKNSVSSASLSSLSSSSSSASSVLEKPRTKRKRRNVKTDAASTKKNCTSKRSSIYRGVTRHRLTGRYEAHLWDKLCWNDAQRKKGRQVYLGAYDCEDAAARTYDLAALKYWGPDTILNFSVEMYEKELEEMQCISREEYLALLRRRSNGFARGLSKFRGVARHHHNGRWEARIGRVLGNKYLYLGTFSNILSNTSNSSFGTQEEAARAYDKAALQYRGPGAVTNFDKGIYVGQLETGVVADPHHQLSQLPNLNCQTILQQQQQLQQSEIVVPQMLPPSAYDANWISTIPTSMIDNSSFLDDCDLSDWISCLDTDFNNQYPVHEFPLGMQDDGLPDIFTAAGFDDDINIDFIFDSGFEENEVYLRCSDGNDGFGGENICSSPSSTTTSTGSS